MNQTRILKVSRLEGLTDGIFAIAMTILVLDLHLSPDMTAINLTAHMTSDIFLKLIIYMGSFIILGTLWVAMNFQLGLLDHVNRPYLWSNVLYLMLVCIVPFSASLVAAYPTHFASITFYAINLICASMAQLLTILCAHAYRLNRDIYTTAIRHAVIQRIFIAPVFYIAALILAHWNMTLAFIALIAPTFLYMLPGKVDHFDQ
ncbi:MAG: TMEM175 family protein [Gammaproteobacteria bacterium]